MDHHHLSGVYKKKDKIYIHFCKLIDTNEKTEIQKGFKIYRNLVVELFKNSKEKFHNKKF